MSITRKFLKGMGLTQEQEDAIIDAHAETVDSLKAERDGYKEDAEKVPQLEKDLAKAQKDLEEASGEDGGWKAKYDSLKTEYEGYKADQKAKEEASAKETAYRKLLSEIGVSDKRIDAVLKVSDVAGVELDDEGSIKGADDLKKSLTEEWADFITTTQDKGADVPTPPDGKTVGSKEAYDAMSLADKMKFANEHPQEYAKFAKQ